MGRMSFKEAISLVDDDLPDGAFWALAHEIAGLEYGDGFPELFEDEPFLAAPVTETKNFECSYCAKRFRTEGSLDQHKRGKHAKRLAKEARR